jgi:hypothetical protein
MQRRASMHVYPSRRLTKCADPTDLDWIVDNPAPSTIRRPSYRQAPCPESVPAERLRRNAAYDCFSGEEDE